MTTLEKFHVIDSDTHVDETEGTWEYLRPEDQGYKPIMPASPIEDPRRPGDLHWLIAGYPRRRKVRSDRITKTTVQTRELMDVEARLRHMDELGTDVQVVYPSLFLRGVTTRPEVELALTRSYNRWLADKCAQARGRLRWICLPPYNSIERAIEELRFAKDHGACGVLKKGDEEAGHWPDDPYFFALYEEAARLDMPICFHTGSGGIREFGYESNFLGIFAPTLNGVTSVVAAGIPSRFPTLRIGAIEAGASWVPLFHYQRRRADKNAARTAMALSKEYRASETNDFFKANRLYVTLQTDEDLALILRFISEDNLLVGSDYGHTDQSKEQNFPALLQERADHEDIPQSAVRKILYDNPKAFYGL